MGGSRYWCKEPDGGDHTCNLCGEPIPAGESFMEYSKGYYGPRYYRHIACHEAKTGDARNRKSLADFKATDYTMSDMHRHSKAVILRWQVERGVHAEALSRLQEVENKSWWRVSRDLHVLAAKFATNPGQVMYQLATDNGIELHGRGGRYHNNSLSLTRYISVRKPLFIAVAKEYKAFLPKISGEMLERIFQRNQEEMRAKRARREAYRSWLRCQKAVGYRVDILDAAALVRILAKRVMTRAGSRHAGRWDYAARNQAAEDLGVAAGIQPVEVTFQAYLTRHGYKFIIQT